MGKAQIGVFVRTPMGATIEMSQPDADELDVELLSTVLRQDVQKLSESLRVALREVLGQVRYEAERERRK